MHTMASLNKLRRICGETLSAPGRVSYSTSSLKGILKKVFGEEIEGTQIHATSL